LNGCRLVPKVLARFCPARPLFSIALAKRTVGEEKEKKKRDSGSEAELSVRKELSLLFALIESDPAFMPPAGLLISDRK